MSENLDELFLEATREGATRLLDNHLERRHDWTVDEIRQKHDYPRLLHEVHTRIVNGQPYEFPEGIKVGLVITLLTENGIIYYPRDVGKIFNPSDKRPSDSDPHEMFTRIWPTEEFPHGEGLRDSLYLTGYDMSRLEEDRKAFQHSGLVPRPDDTASGVAYTGTQELSTNKPYRNIRKLLRETIDQTDDELVRDVCEFIYDIVGHVGKDERLHAAFINGNAELALLTRDKKLVSFMLQGYANTVIDFYMPGKGGIPNFRRLQVEAARNKIFTPQDVAEIKLSQYRKTLQLVGNTALTQEGNVAQLEIVQDMEKITDKYPDLLAA